MVKKSRTGKKKHSKYQMSAKEKASVVKEPTPEERLREKKRMRYNGTALAVLSVSLFLILFAPKFATMGLQHEISAGVAYACTMVAGVLMLLSVKYAQEDRKTTSRITGALMLFVGVFGLYYTFAPVLPFSN